MYYDKIQANISTGYIYELVTPNDLEIYVTIYYGDPVFYITT